MEVPETRPNAYLARRALAISRMTRGGLSGRPPRASRGGVEKPLTPPEFARRSTGLYPNREAVVDGELRLTYEQLFQRCDRWSAALQKLGVRKGDRVAYI